MADIGVIFNGFPEHGICEDASFVPEPAIPTNGNIICHASDSSNKLEATKSICGSAPHVGGN